QERRRRRQERQARRGHPAPDVQEGRHDRLHRALRHGRRDPLPRLRHRQGRRRGRQRALPRAREDRRPLRGRAREPQGADRRGGGPAVRARARVAAAGAAVATAALAAAPDPAAAHGLVGRQDLPIPRWLFAWAAATVLVASFVGLAALWPRPRLQRMQERVAGTVPRLLDPLFGALGIAIFVLVVYAGLAGTQSATANLAPTVIYVLFWVGIPFASALFGDVFRAINPWRALARAVAWTARRIAGEDNLPDPLPYPQRLGRWPAVVT